MARNYKKKDKAKEIEEASERFDERASDPTWFFVSVVERYLLDDIAKAIETKNITIPDDSSFSMEQLKERLAFLDELAQKTIEAEEKRIKQQKHKSKLN